MRTRVADDDLSGGVLFVADGDATVHRFATGAMTANTVIPIASASKWLTSATLMTFVDEGKLALDDSVASHLAGFSGAKADITVRQLLSHRTGLPSAACEGDPGTTLARCVREIAHGGDPTTPPGSAFAYRGVGFVIAGRLIERLSGISFEEAFESRIARPLGMTRTRFDGTSRPHNRNPAPAASARSSVADYARFLAMLAHDGTVDGHTVLQPSSVAEIERDQVAGLDTSGDGAVQITGIPTYGLGVWRDVVERRRRDRGGERERCAGLLPVDRPRARHLRHRRGRRRAPRARSRGAGVAGDRADAVGGRGLTHRSDRAGRNR